MLPCRCTLLPPAARRPITGVIVTVRQARRWSATLLDRRTGLRQALHFWIGVYILDLWRWKKSFCLRNCAGAKVSFTRRFAGLIVCVTSLVVRNSYVRQDCKQR